MNGPGDREPIADIALTVLILAIIAAIVTCFGGCSLAYPPNDPRVPLPAPTIPIAVLLAEPFINSEHAESPFAIRLSPPFVLAGGATWFSCLTPASYGKGRIAMSFNGTGYYSERDIDTIERRVLIERIPCGKHVARCTVQTRRGVEIREQLLESRGECSG